MPRIKDIHSFIPSHVMEIADIILAIKGVSPQWHENYQVTRWLNQ